MLVLAAVAVALRAASATTVLEVGACPNVTSIPDLDMKELTGKWYHILHFPSDDEPFEACARSSYNYTEGYLEVLTEGLDFDGSDITRSGVLGKLQDSPSDALQLDLDGMPPLSMWVAYTDYTSLLCMYSCTSFPGLRADWAWALTRTRHPQPRLMLRCRTKLRKLGVNAAKFVRVPQSGAVCKVDKS
ncbi:apolipoprotein D-like [Penaeus japonicus]|uniref:apolipoprotein D-like n=1 Tax=Penaeus japonicus TaxID=27405 RepID=UPI001C713743|nr:apolipoprotein D-like [Penaeus japonicus]